MDCSGREGAGPSRKCPCRKGGGSDNMPPNKPKKEKCSCSSGRDASSAETSYSDLTSAESETSYSCGKSKISNKFTPNTNRCPCPIDERPLPSGTSYTDAEDILAGSSLDMAFNNLISSLQTSCSLGHPGTSHRPPPVIMQLRSDCPCSIHDQAPTPTPSEAPYPVCSPPAKPPRKDYQQDEKCTCDDDEFLSLNSTSSEQEEVTVKEIPTCFNESAHNPCDYCPKTHVRNQAILSLLTEVAHLITDDKTSSEVCQPRIRNIGVYEHGRSQDGAFSSSLKITFTAAPKETSQTCSRPCTDASDGTTGTTGAGGGQKRMPNAMQIENFNDENIADVTPVTIKQEPTDTQENAPVINDPEIIEDGTPIIEEPTSMDDRTSVQTEGIGIIEQVGEVSTTKTESRTDGEETTVQSEAFPQYTTDATTNAKSIEDSCLSECICNAVCVCPVHGPIKTPPLNTTCVCSEDLVGSQCELSCTEPGIEEGDGEGEASEEGENKPKSPKSKMKGDDDHCNCCHCRAIRAQKNDCRTIATPEQTKEGGTDCNEFKYFIDSIIMDLDAMENVRRAKKAQQNICPPPKPSICPRQSFPVTITEVTDLGTSSLYVKWCIHNCYGIAGYEIYVDNHLTNRYFHCNHTAAVVCDVDVTAVHKIVLLAQPKLDDVYADLCADNADDKCKSLLAKSDIEKGDSKECNPSRRSSVWIASIYMYDPLHKQEEAPIMRCSTRI